MARIVAAASLFAVFLATHAAAGTCPPVTIAVDNDTPGSGYSEDPAANFQSHNAEPCKTTYRYLSKYVGDGSSKGKAIWTPNISVAGMYAVKSGYRGSENRTTNADYFAYGDDGNVIHKVVDQKASLGCTYADLGQVYCKPGGSCRLVLDGNDGQSAAADITTFQLVSCDGPAPPADAGAGGPCDGIAANPAYEVCETTATTCAGVFSDGSGCVAFCAAAGMTCKARYGGSPGCAKEPPPALACDAVNGHQSDWCECAAKPGPADAGPATDAGMGTDAGMDAAPDAPTDAPADAPKDAPSDSPFTPVDGSPPPGTGGAGAGGAPSSSGGAAGASGGGLATGGAPVALPDTASDTAQPSERSTCSCSVPRAEAPGIGSWLALATFTLARGRRRSRQPRSAG